MLTFKCTPLSFYLSITDWEIKLLSFRDKGALSLCLLLPFVQFDAFERLDSQESVSERSGIQ
jgi:hypothetical protein